MKKLNYCLLLPAMLFWYVPLYSQDNLSIGSGIIDEKLFNGIAMTADHITSKLRKQTLQVLVSMEKEELRLRRKLVRKDSVAGNRLFGNTKMEYEALRSGLADVVTDVSSAREYSISMDTIEMSLRFLQQRLILSGQLLETGKAKSILGKLNETEMKLVQAESIRQYLKERRSYLKEQLSGFGLLRHMQKMNKKMFYYSQVIKEYKILLGDPRKHMTKALAALARTPAFKKFMNQYSQYSGLFGRGTDENVHSLSSEGLQSRSAIQHFIQDSVPISGSDAGQFLSEQLDLSDQQGSAKISIPIVEELADNLGDIPQFKPNRQKGKTLKARLEYGTNIQFGRTNRFFPVTSEMAIFLGYKLNSDAVIGIGSSYKLGMGSGIRNIRFSHQGFGIRSYIDWKIKGSLYLSGGYEKNYLPLLKKTIGTTVPITGWQESGLIGVSKKYSMRKNKKGTIQLLFDLLSYRNAPQSRPLIIRTGINF